MDAKREEQIIELIRKCMALAESSNPHEAALAAAKANDLIAKHNIDRARLNPGERIDYVLKMLDLFDPGERDKNIFWRQRLGMAIAQNTFCKGFFVRGKPLVMVIGKPFNIDAVEFLFVYLRRELNRMCELSCETEKPTHVNRTKWRNSYLQGAVSTIWRRLSERHQVRSDDPNTKALVVQFGRELDDAFEKLVGGRMRHSKWSPTDVQAYVSGARAGERVNLSTPIQGNSGQRSLN